MGQAILPFLGYVVLQLAVTVVGLNVIHEKELSASGVLKSWIFGQMILFAVLQIVAVPMILLRWKFDILVWCFTCISTVLFCFGCWRFAKGKTKIKIRMPELKPLGLLLLMIVVLLVLWQVCNYFFGIHLDEDDARWLAEANDARVYGDMMTRNFFTGEFEGTFRTVRDVTSPWPMMWAIVSRLLFTRTSIFAHTIYAPIELFLMYCLYWLIGRELFKKAESRLLFMISVAMINLFLAGSGYTQSVFSLIRIWQGKATTAAVMIPFIFYLFILLYKNNDNILSWIIILISGFAACLMSGAGMVAGLVMIFILGLYDIVAYQRWKRIYLWLLSILPPVLYNLAYMWLKG